MFPVAAGGCAGHGKGRSWQVPCVVALPADAGNDKGEVRVGAAGGEVVQRGGLSADVDHGAGSGDEVGFSDVVALFFVEDDAADEVGEFGIG